MKRCAALLLVVVLVAGCGGFGSNSPYAGKWDGTWVGGAFGSGSTITMTVANDGGVSGSVETPLSTQNPTVSGTISASGKAVLAYVFQGSIYSAQGTLSRDSSNHLVGTLSESKNGHATGIVTVDLAPQ